MVDRDQEEQMIVAAWLYYDEGLTQEKIAEQLDLSRVSVTRLLKKAREEGIVEIRLAKPLPVQYDLARQLSTQFGIEDAIVTRSYASTEQTLDAVGLAGAAHLNRKLFPDCRLGVIGWGFTVSYMAPHLKRTTVKPCAVNELIGSFLGMGHRYSVSMRIAEVLGVPIETLPAPVVVRSKAARDALLKERSIHLSLQHARQCDIAIAGLGDVRLESTVVKAGQLSPAQVDELRRVGVTGEILLRFYDSEGRPVITKLDEQVISMDWDDIYHIPYVMALASGPHKVPAILGALRGKLCHCLITDARTAQQVLEQDQESL